MSDNRGMTLKLVQGQTSYDKRVNKNPRALNFQLRTSRYSTEYEWQDYIN